jgi:hypothetical protein
MLSTLKKLVFTALIGIVPFVCTSQKSEITKEFDKFTGATTYRTPFFSKGAVSIEESVAFTKIIKQDSTTSFFIYLTAPGLTPAVNVKGAIVLFTNGQRLDYPDSKVDVDVRSGASGSYYLYSTFIAVDEATIRLFADNTVDGIRLYIFDSNIRKKELERISTNAKAILEAK